MGMCAEVLVVHECVRVCPGVFVYGLNVKTEGCLVSVLGLCLCTASL